MATITQLEYLIAVDQFRHFGKAAKACHISQPTLSMQLKKLEEEYGVVFFDRSKQPILPNERAEKLIAQAKVVLREMEKLEHLSRNQESELSGDLKLAIIPTIAPYLIPEFLGYFAKKFPKINLFLDEMTTDQILEALENDRIDAGILATPLHIHSLVEWPLYYEPFWLYVSKNHELAKMDKIREDKLEAKDIWLLGEGHCFRNQVVSICSWRGNPGTFPNVRFESGSLESVIHLVDQGHGYTLLPQLATLQLKHANDGILKPFAKPIPSREVSIVFRRTQFKKDILEALKHTILEHLQNDLPREKTKSIEVVSIK